ncbi:hypothetical protein [Aliikangiella coralliicola]|uniref:DUF2790 domain-containing protein n=1 Tax=Aliikangiella coralliicola TaxID=2592383 RepID=A0A545UEP3_9GAMM|nr:hypothetical protein [Aliikangiella coralliicola]TQV87928.1 hypothetical protein FLL46_11155 [Aliikangiella coralliicola]
MKLLKTITSFAIAGSILFSINTNAVQTGGKTYVTECEYMPVGEFTIPLVDTLESTNGYKSCPATKIVNTIVHNFDSGEVEYVRKAVHYHLFYEKKYMK